MKDARIKPNSAPDRCPEVVLLLLSRIELPRRRLQLRYGVTKHAQDGVAHQRIFNISGCRDLAEPLTDSTSIPSPLPFTRLQEGTRTPDRIGE